MGPYHVGNYSVTETKAMLSLHSGYQISFVSVMELKL